MSSIKVLSSLCLAILMTACIGAGGRSSVDSISSDPDPVKLGLSFGIKRLHFSWPAVQSATFYRLEENPDGTSGFTQVGTDIPADTLAFDLDIAVHRHDWVNSRYLLEACNAQGCISSKEISSLSGMLKTTGYIKASNTRADDFFGWSVALSTDGNTLAVGALGEDAATSGINGTQNDSNADDSGEVYVYSNTGSGWSLQANIKAVDPAARDGFGSALALSADGTTLAVGAAGKSNNAGAAYIFKLAAGNWSQQQSIQGAGVKAGDKFGFSVALSGDGSTIAVGAPNDSSGATGVDGTSSETVENSGAVYVFARIAEAGSWSQQAYVKAFNTGSNAGFGVAVSLDATGDTLAVGANGESSSSIGINSSPNTDAPAPGAAYVYTRSGGAWSQQAYVKASNAFQGDYFGYALALSADGNTLAVSAYLESSASTGVNGIEADNSASSRNSGAVYVYSRNGTNWTQQAYVKASNTGSLDNFGISLALSPDGDTLAVGAFFEDSSAKGINGNQSDNSATNSGAVYVYRFDGTTWSQQSYVKASNTDAGDEFGVAVALSDHGNILAVGALREGSSAVGVGGDQTDNSAANAGAVYFY